MSCILFIIQFHLTLALLSHARHYGQCVDLLRLYTQFFCEIRLHSSTEHLLW